MQNRPFFNRAPQNQQRFYQRHPFNVQEASAFNSGVHHGRQVGIAEGIERGRQIGLQQGQQIGLQQGQQIGLQQGQQIGLQQGQQIGLQQGQQIGLAEGLRLGYLQGQMSTAPNDASHQHRTNTQSRFHPYSRGQRRINRLPEILGPQSCEMPSSQSESDNFPRGSGISHRNPLFSYPFYERSARADGSGLKCQFCNKVYPTRENIRNHLYTDHFRVHLFYCGHCSGNLTIYKSFEDVRSHAQLEHPEHILSLSKSRIC